jgi:hypothetical protein
MTAETNEHATLTQHLIAQAVEQISELNKTMGEMRGDMGALKSSIDRLTPLVDKHEERHNQALGAMHFGKWIWTVVAGGTGAAVMSVAQWLVGGHPGQHP